MNGNTMADGLSPRAGTARQFIVPPVWRAPGFEFIDCHPRLDSLRDEVWAGLSSCPKTLEPKFFYDEAGSCLFERICGLPEYYPTRCETEILETCAGEMRELIGAAPLLVEYGSGNSRKIRPLIDALEPAAYIAIDISRKQLVDACGELGYLHPDLPITAICADYGHPVHLPANVIYGPARRIAFFPGSTIGNFTPEDAVRFLRNVRVATGESGGLLIGVDMKKNRERLNIAYNDSEGITAAFNLNLLHRINRELDADFNTEAFLHHAFYNQAAGRIEMHLVSRRMQRVRIAGRMFRFDAGESIHTENSYKYAVDEFRALAAQAGFGAGRVWMDSENLFSVHYLDAV